MRHGSIWLLLGALVVTAVTALSIACVAPPEVRGADAAPGDFSAVRARVHIEAIARKPHPVGSDAHEEVRAYILGTLHDLGVEAHVQESHAALKAAAVIHAARVKNVIARLPGTERGPAVMLAAHYDSVPQSHGASDDGSGVATLLETTRALLQGPRLRNDVLLVFTDAEENAGCGSLAFTDEELAHANVGVALNFEARGTRGAVALYDTSANNGALIDALAHAAPRVVSTSLLGSLARALPNDSDATLWKRAGIPTYAFAYVDNVYQYHQSTDDLGALDLRSLQHDGDYALPLARYLGDHPLPLPSSPAVAYFDVFGRTVVSYSSNVARLLGVLTLAGLGALIARERRRGVVRLRGVAKAGVLAALTVLAAMAAAGLVHLALWAMLGTFTLFAHPWLASSSGVLVAAPVVAYLFLWRVRDRDATQATLGSLGAFGVLLALTTAFVPGASFAFQWPLAGAVAGAWVALPQREEKSGRADACAMLSLVPAGFFWGYVAYTVFVMVGGRLPELTAGATAFASLLAAPAVARVPRSLLRKLALMSATLGVALALVGAIVVRTSLNVPVADSLVYELILSKRPFANWTTTSARHDAFVAQRIPQGSLSATADTYDLAAPVTHTESVQEGPLRHVRLHMVSQRRARCIGIWEQSHVPIVRTRIDGRDVVDIARFSPEIDEKIVRLYTGGRAQADWVMEYCGADERGFDLELFTPSQKPIRVRILEYVDGLPGPRLIPRSAGDGYPGPESDQTTAMLNLSL